MPYGKALYVEEKEKGIRKANGAVKLKKLKVWHRTAIALHVAGVKGIDIAELVGRRANVVSLILHDPLAEEVIERYKGLAQKDLDALYFKSISVLHDVLDNGNQTAKLNATKQVFEQFEKSAANNEGGKTAEDVIQAILQNADSVTFEMREKPKVINPEE